MAGKYNYNYKNGGFLGFEGVQVSLKELSSIKAVFSDSDTHLTVTAEYSDENTERIEIDVEEITGGIEITGVKHYWNDKLVQGDDE